jgi:putative transposase
MSTYYRKLPHQHPDDAWLFVTWRLAGSLPSQPQVLTRNEPRVNAGAAFAAFERSLDQAKRGPKWLADARITRLVTGTLIAGEQERNFYQLRAWVLMPNHVHVLWLPRVPMPMISRWIKSSTARSANLQLGRTASAFWQAESYDHWLRNTNEMEKTVHYIEMNPVRAGLAATPEDWVWSSSHRAGETACPMAAA